MWSGGSFLPGMVSAMGAIIDIRSSTRRHFKYMLKHLKISIGYGDGCWLVRKPGSLRGGQASSHDHSYTKAKEYIESR